MPGLSLHIKYYKSLDFLTSTNNPIYDSLLHDLDYVKQELVKNDYCLAIFTGYIQYPIITLHFHDVEVFIEGKIYNKSKSELNIEIRELVEILIKPSWESEIKNWLQKLDGDFLIFIFNKRQNTYVIINDILGRLPVYIYNDKNQVIISRELKFIFKQIPNKEIEKFGVAENLLFGYPLGKRTLLKEVERIQPASIIIIEPKKVKCSVKQVSDFNFENKTYGRENIDQHIKNLTDLFIEGTRNRIENNKFNILSLSGGFDSRSVLGALRMIGKNFRTISFSGYSKTSNKDANIARLLSKELNFEWELMDIGNPTGSDLKELLYFKDGTNILWQSFLNKYYREVKQKYSRDLLFFTGDGGDKVFPDHRALRNLSDEKSLVKYIISNKYFFTTKKISELLSINENEFTDHLAHHFSTYPESSSNYKYLRFIIVERGLKWLFETEDKNRFFFWSVAPMYSYPFFNYAMNIPDELKSNYFLYLRFLSKINPESMQFDHALLNIPLNSNNIKYKSLMYVKDKVYPQLPANIKRILRMRLGKIEQFKINNIPLLSSLVSTLCDKKSINHLFNKKIILNLGSISKIDFYILLTLLNSVEYYIEDSSSLSSYLLEEFI